MGLGVGQHQEEGAHLILDIVVSHQFLLQEDQEGGLGRFAYLQQSVGAIQFFPPHFPVPRGGASLTWLLTSVR